MSTVVGSFRPGRSLVLALCAFLVPCLHARAQGDPLPSWNDGPAKQSVVAFVRRSCSGRGDRRPALSRDNDRPPGRLARLAAHL